jgi:hypothetical protein
MTKLRWYDSSRTKGKIRVSSDAWSTYYHVINEANLHNFSGFYQIFSDSEVGLAG